MAPTLERFKLSRRATASKWSTLWEGYFVEAAKARGKGTAPDGTFIPRITNREAMSLIRAWRTLTSDFSLWYQFAAIAYGWTVKRDTLTVNDAQASKLYPLDATNELWVATYRIALALDDARRADPAMSLDDNTFVNAMWAAEVRKALREDGAKADFTGGGWVIGFGGCKDPKTGKPRPPRGKCDVVNTPAGPILKNCKLECDPSPIVIRDPLGMKPLFLLALIVGAWWAYGNKPRRGRDR